MQSGGTFVQVGATRDGLDPYLDAARRRGLTAVLVETPDYLRWRELLGRRPFDRVVPVSHPADPTQLLDALRAAPITGPHLMLAGFERYTASTYSVAEMLGVLPARQSPGFAAPYKRAQRTAVADATIRVGQPRHTLVDSLDRLASSGTRMSFPVVVKPGDGGGGLGVLLVSQPDGFDAAARLLRGVTNYDGGGFEGWLVEEYVKGIELSVQGIARDGDAEILTFCEKLITVEPEQEPLLSSFRESGHVAYPGEEADAVLRTFTQACLEAVRYRQGPFHVDLVRDGNSLQLLEMGFRLSGMRVTEIVAMVSGRDWAEEAFRAHLGEPAGTGQPPDRLRYAGHLTMRRPAELTAAQALVGETGDYRIEVAAFAPPHLPEQWQHELPATLRSDIGRHAGAVGRVVVRANAAQLVTRLLESCRGAAPADRAEATSVDA